MQEFKLVIVGESTVGKTCFFCSSWEKAFPRYQPLAFEPNSLIMKISEEKKVSFQLWDTAGNEDYDHLRPLAYPETDIVLFMFSVIDKRSFEYIEKRWIPEIEKFLPSVNKILVGSKMDLRKKSPNNDLIISNDDLILPEIPKEEGIKLAKKIKASKYIECSSLNQKGLETVFKEAAKICLEKPEKKPKCKLN
ncbi:gtpase crac1b [Anaeramoeba ignava]|uniref:Gtpase crac1b n=1 Tax=Anaeramoeba ignava TaxID=1746090 RepID=A0A9Q0LB10_ANAIG|nr:gtpase crac1b [Anaeramoeba ignava]